MSSAEEKKSKPTSLLSLIADAFSSTPIQASPLSSYPTNLAYITEPARPARKEKR